jgi:hypothetical protein
MEAALSGEEQARKRGEARGIANRRLKARLEPAIGEIRGKPWPP